MSKLFLSKLACSFCDRYQAKQAAAADAMGDKQKLQEERENRLIDEKMRELETKHAEAERVKKERQR